MISIYFIIRCNNFNTVNIIYCTYRDYIIKPPLNKHLWCNKEYRIVEISNEILSISIIDKDKYNARLKTKYLPIRIITCDYLNKLIIKTENQKIKEIEIDGTGVCELELHDNISNADKIPTTLSLPYNFTD